MKIHRSFRVAPELAARRTDPPREGTALLINPFYAKDPTASLGKHVLTPTLALTSVASATPNHWDVRLWDENLLQGPPPCDPFPQVVGITVHLTFAARAYELARWFRARGAIVVMGGLHVMSCPDEVRPHADVLAFGDGVQTWPRILQNIERRGSGSDLEREVRAEFDRPYERDPAPRRDLVPHESFLTSTSVIATRGCHNRCTFCYLSTRGLHMPYRMRAPEQVAEEIRASGRPYAVFLDNNLGSKPEYLRAVCRALAPLEIIWSAAVTVDVTDDPALVRDMALSGCTGVFVGLESLNFGNIRDASKKSPAPEDYARRVRVFHDVGIQVNGSFVLGFDHDTRAVFGELGDWVEEQRMECATFHILTPYPGTPLFAEMEREGRIIHRDWNLYDTAYAVFRPRHMEPEELEFGYRALYRRTFSHSSIWRRRPVDPRSVPAYLMSSYLYKRSNWLWALLIRRRWTERAWKPLVELNRRRHLRFRAELERDHDRSFRRAPEPYRPGV